MQVQPQLDSYAGDNRRWPVLVWRLARSRTCISSAPLVGGVTRPRWVINAQVPRTYRRTDPDRHLGEVAAALGLDGPGVGMLTAADVRRCQVSDCEGVAVAATVGLALPTWAAVPGAGDPAGATEALGTPGTTGAPGAPGAGTINVVVSIPERLSPAALVNAVATATEAKCQALWEAGVAGTGTATDAVCICSDDGGPPAAFAGPRSPVGDRLARAVHLAVGSGARDWPAARR